jgi:Rieske 2Fe-2S family protein
VSNKRGREGNDERKVNRRDFAKTSVAAGAAAVVFPSVLGADVSTGGMTSAAGDAAAQAGGGAKKEFPSGWREGTTIPAEYYLDAKHYHNDERYLADNFWFMVDHVNRIPKPGDYFTFEYGRGESVIILRDNAGKINAYHNVCRHRGSRLCRDSDDPRPGDKRLSVLQLAASGNTPLFRCPYHGWTYDLDGNLISAYKMQKDFDLSKNGLVPCHMRVDEGHIFVSLSRKDKPPDFDAAMEWYRPVAQKYGFADLKIAARRTYPIKANWKLAIENFLECYHCGPSHRSLVTTHNWDYTLSDQQQAQRIKDLEGWVCEESKKRATEQQGMGSAGSSYAASYSGELNPGFMTGSLDGKPVAPLLPKFKEWSHCTDIATTGYSTAYWQAYDDHVAVARFTPRDTAFTDCEIFWLVNPNAVEGKDYQGDRVMALWDITIQEDIWIVENNHLGVTSGAYGPGRYADNEGGPADFIKWYMGEVIKV